MKALATLMTAAAVTGCSAPVSQPNDIGRFQLVHVQAPAWGAMFVIDTKTGCLDRILVRNDQVEVAPVVEYPDDHNRRIKRYPDYRPNGSLVNQFPDDLDDLPKDPTFSCAALSEQTRKNMK